MHLVKRTMSRSDSAPPIDKHLVFLRNDAGVCEIPDVISVVETFGALPRVGFAQPTHGSTIQLRVAQYRGPEELQGLLVSMHGPTALVTFDAKLVKVAQVNVGITELVFRAQCDKNGNSPTLGVDADLGQRVLTGPMPNRENPFRR